MNILYDFIVTDSVVPHLQLTFREIGNLLKTLIPTPMITADHKEIFKKCYVIRSSKGTSCTF